MATKTRADLVQEAAENIFVANPGMTLQDEDYAAINAKVDTLLADLAARNVCYVQDEEDIDLAWFEALGELLAISCGPKYGIAKNPAARLDAEDRIKTAQRKEPPKDRLSVDRAIRCRQSIYTQNQWRNG